MKRPRKPPPLRIERHNRVVASLNGDSMTAAVACSLRIDAMVEKGWRRDAAAPTRNTVLLFANDEGDLFITRDCTALAVDITTSYPKWVIGHYREGTAARVIAEDIAHEAGLRAMGPQTKVRTA